MSKLNIIKDRLVWKLRNLMSWFNFYHVRDTGRYVWSIRIKRQVFILRADKINYKWKWKFVYYKLEDLDIVGLYYEVGYGKFE